jgi:hypothetical protein
LYKSAVFRSLIYPEPKSMVMAGCCNVQSPGCAFDIKTKRRKLNMIQNFFTSLALYL